MLAPSDRECIGCGTSFTTRRNAVYCTAACAHRHQAPRRVPYPPVEDRLVAVTGRPRPVNGDTRNDALSLRFIAERVGVSARTVCRWRSTGTIPIPMLERLAHAFGVHPANLSNDYYPPEDQ